MLRGTEKKKGKLEFDVIIDGKTERRVANGILVELTDDHGVNIYSDGKRMPLFTAVYVLSDTIIQAGLEKEFDEFMKEQLAE